MTHFPDLTPYIYDRTNFGFDVPTLNVGWLDISVPCSTGATPQQFQEVLLDFCLDEYTAQYCMGYHECQYCINPPWSIVVQHRSGKEVVLGGGEIRVIGNSIIYASPTLIYHYVSAHNYKPPDEFVEAVLNGPRPGSEEHQAVLAKLHP
jgi:hypothetical protein